MQKKMLTALFSSAARVAVLRVFMLDPTRAYYQRQLAAATDLPIRAVQRELERMASIALLYRRLEGNRAYYQVDTDFLLFPELRAMILKSVGPVERLRGVLAMVGELRLAFLAGDGERVLLVGPEEAATPPQTPPQFLLEHMDVATFRQGLDERAALLEPFLIHGADLFGRRDDVIWRRIEAAGYSVPKGAGVP